MRRLLVFVALLVPLAVAPAAAGKELSSVTACGSDGCDASRAAGLLRALRDVGPPADAPRRPGAFYTLTMRVGGDDGRDVPAWWVPSAGRLLGEDGTWIAARPAARSALNRLVEGLAPRPAATLPGFPEDGAAAPSSGSRPPAAGAAASSASSGVVMWALVLGGAAAVAVIALAHGARRRERASRIGSGVVGPL